MLLESKDRIELVLAAKVAEPFALVGGVLVPRPVVWVQTAFVFVSVSDKLFDAGVVMKTFIALPRVDFYRIVELQWLGGFFVIFNDAQDELLITIVLKELYGLPFALLKLSHNLFNY